MYNRQVCTCVEFVADVCADTVNSVVVTLKKESVYYFNSMSFPVDCPVFEENSINILYILNEAALAGIFSPYCGLSSRITGSYISHTAAR